MVQFRIYRYQKKTTSGKLFVPSKRVKDVYNAFRQKFPDDHAVLFKLPELKIFGDSDETVLCPGESVGMYCCEDIYRGDFDPRKDKNSVYRRI